MFDVAIIGGSFAGLATAMQLKDHRVVLVDQYPIGAQQTSTCGVPLRLAQMVGAGESIYEVHEAINLHMAGREIRFPLPEPYATFHYRAFCKAMLERANVEILQARATGFSGGEVTTTSGPVSARFVVDATGWRSFAGRRVQNVGSLPGDSRGIETELPLRAKVSAGLHFYFERRLVTEGYAWIFPCGERTRIGVASSASRPHLRSRLRAFMNDLGLEVGTTHGGVMPTVRREPVQGDLFVVGDAAGQCLPVSLEGIRIAIMNGLTCGRLIDSALSGDCSADEARAQYRRYVQRTELFHQRLSTMHSAVERVPESLLSLAASACSPAPISRRILNLYFRSTGWEPEPAGRVARAAK